MNNRIKEILGFSLKKGDKIELIAMIDDPRPIELGTKGIVTGTHVFPSNEVQIQVEWENGRCLNLICPPDKFKVIS